MSQMVIATFNPQKSIKPFEWKGWELTYVKAPIQPFVHADEILLELVEGPYTSAWCCASTRNPIVVSGSATPVSRVVG